MQCSTFSLVNHKQLRTQLGAKAHRVTTRQHDGPCAPSGAKRGDDDDDDDNDDDDDDDD